MIDRILDIVVVLDLGKRSSLVRWIKSLDLPTQAILDRRIGRLRLGNYGDWKSVGGGVFELRVHEGPGYRIYYAFKHNELVILLYGGKKQSQSKDIKKARWIWSKIKHGAIKLRKYSA